MSVIADHVLISAQFMAHQEDNVMSNKKVDTKKVEPVKAAPKKVDTKKALLKELDGMKTFNTPRAKQVVTELLKLSLGA